MLEINIATTILLAITGRFARCDGLTLIKTWSYATIALYIPPVLSRCYKSYPNGF